MEYNALRRKLEILGYQFRAQYGQFQSITSDPPLVKILHRYPGRKVRSLQTSIGYVTRLDFSGSPDDTRLFWSTCRIEEKGRPVYYVGSDWSQLRHILSCERASTKRSQSL